MNEHPHAAHWLARARAVTGAADTHEALEKLRPATQRLSDLFTAERPGGKFPDYAAAPALLAAYGLFFFPQSYARVCAALDQPARFRGWRPVARPGEPLRVLDLGSGAGACGLGAIAVLRELAPGRDAHLTAVDHSPAALAALREVAAEAGVSVETHTADLRRADVVLANIPPQDVVVAGFSANEVFGGDAAALRNWLASLRPRLASGGLLLVLEPALRETAIPLQRAADALAAAGVFHRWAPDLGDAPFPLLDATAAANGTGRNANAGRFHPHEVRRWTPPESLAFLNRTLFRDVGVLKFSYTALGVEAPPPLPTSLVVFRLVSPLEPQKGRVVCAGVAADGRRLTVEIPVRGLAKSEVKAFAAAWERGDVLGAEPAALKPLGVEEGVFRVAGFSELKPLYVYQERGRG
jgi:SAM-dependent methyltransferase